MNQHIDEALDSFRLKQGRYAKFERYYAGSHDLAFATEKFQNAFGSMFREFALNLCPAICDSVADKLRVVGFSVDSLDDDAGLAAAAADTRRIWNANRMRMRAGEVHGEAVKCGDAYMIVWPNAAGEAVLYPNRASTCTVVYDDEQPGRIIRAAKYWRTADKRVRLNLFFPDRIEKYVSRDICEGALPAAESFVPFDRRTSRAASKSGGEQAESSTISNPYGVVPVFHFANNADIGDLGRSELEPAIPIQDGLNKSMLDMLVAMEFSAYRQRWAAGIEVEFDAEGKLVPPFKAGVDHLWISQNADARFGDFSTADLEQFLRVKDGFRGDIASVTGTPLHYFTSDLHGYNTAEGLRKSESRFVAKIRGRQEYFGQLWADVMSFALAVEGRGTGIRLLTEWEDPAPISDREFLENILLKKQIGLPVEQALIEAGYGKADAKLMVNGSGFE